jgi:hypothetical protein
MTFVTRLALLVIAAIIASIIGSAFIAYGAGARVSAEIEQARVSHLLAAVKGEAETSLSIGLSLDQISLLQSRIEREKASDPSILAIDVFNPTGRAIYSTDLSLIGEGVPAGWLKRLGAGGIWHAEDRGETVFGTHFENDLGTAGGIAVTVSDQAQENRMQTLGIDIVVRAFVLCCAAAFIALLLALLYAHVLTRPFDHVARVLAGEEASSVDDGALGRLADQARHSWSTAEAHIDKGLSQLGALDDAA